MSQKFLSAPSLPVFAADPAGTAGDSYFNSVTKSQRVHNGTVWVDVGSAVSNAARFSSIEHYGHSYTQLTTTGPSRNGQRWPDKLALSIGAENLNFGINGAKLCWADSSVDSGGWNAMFHTLLRKRDLARDASANMPPESSVGTLYAGINDLPRLGSAKIGTTGPYGNALRACISRWRASKHYPSSDASNAYVTAGNFTADTSLVYGAPDPPATEIAKRTTVTGGTITITVPAEFPGGAITLYFPVDPTTTGANTITTKVDAGAVSAALTVSGAAVFDNSANTSGGAAITTTGRSCIVPKRLTGLAAGTHTIVITITIVSGAVLYGGYDVESINPPPFVVFNQPKVPPSIGYGLWNLPNQHGFQGTVDQGPVTDTGVNSLNATMSSVCGEFDSSVLYVDVDTSLAQNTAYWPPATANDSHINDAGCSRIAGLGKDALAALTASWTSERKAMAAVLPSVGDTPNDVSAATSNSGVSIFGRSRSPKLHLPVSTVALTTTLAATTALDMLGGANQIELMDFVEFRMTAFVTTGLASAVIYLVVQNVFGFTMMDVNAIAHPAFGELSLATAGFWTSQWQPIFPQLRRGTVQIKPQMYSTGAGNVTTNQLGIQFR